MYSQTEIEELNKFKSIQSFEKRKKELAAKKPQQEAAADMSAFFSGRTIRH
jgi:hypothetical protein